MKLGIVSVAKRPWYLPRTKIQRDHTIQPSGFSLSQFRLLAQMREPLAEDPDGTLGTWVFLAFGGFGPIPLYARSRTCPNIMIKLSQNPESRHA